MNNANIEWLSLGLPDAGGDVGQLLFESFETVSDRRRQMKHKK